ncbi:hypothetical protein K0P33_27520 [Pseudomonas sp. ArH3a]|uniref:hypothetical protein n=1 Tax=unclassified Pseudomonas TaxID=196821 RepID=UPI001F5991E9|nr:hypothetical protein [Pseudomonas sp. ArH3a]UNM19213.1 hypothetical protein K0P33_27520 [Pseudomonas sp. ArH3a]
MKPSLLSVEKVFFLKVRVDSNPDWLGDYSDELLQIAFDYKGSRFTRKVELGYPEDEISDPRNFSVALNLRLVKSTQEDGFDLPYDVDITAMALIRYRSDQHSGSDRFRVVRHAAYTILYGAIREMTSTLTARSVHGMWSLPAADFASAAREEGEVDEAERLESIGQEATVKDGALKKTKRRPKQKNQSKSDVE